MLSSFLYNREKLIKKLEAVKPSPARTAIIKMLDTNRTDLIMAVIDTWFEKNYGVKPFNTTLKIPDMILPNGTTDEVFQVITDHFKKCI